MMRLKTKVACEKDLRQAKRLIDDIRSRASYLSKFVAADYFHVATAAGQAEMLKNDIRRLHSNPAPERMAFDFVEIEDD